MSDISPPTGLKPATKFFKEAGEEVVNADGVIAIMQRIDTPRKYIHRIVTTNPAQSAANPKATT